MNKGTRSRTTGSRVRAYFRLHVPVLTVCTLLIVLLVSGAISSGPVADNSQSHVPSLQAFSAMATHTVPPFGTPTYAPTVSLTPGNLTPIATAMRATHVAYATEVATNLEALRTSVALTHAPTDVPGPPSPAASPTPMLGILPGCSNTNAYEPQAISCWRGVVNGELVEVDAGREGRNGDTSQGMVRVSVRGQQNMDVYNTPNRVGPVRIVSVSGPLFTLSTVDPGPPQILVFNLATKQWVSP